MSETRRELPDRHELVGALKTHLQRLAPFHLDHEPAAGLAEVAHHRVEFRHGGAQFVGAPK